MRGLNNSWNRNLAVAQAPKNAHSVKIRHNQVKDQQVNRRFYPILQSRNRCFSAIKALSIIAKASHHCFQQATLHRIVINN